MLSLQRFTSLLLTSEPDNQIYLRCKQRLLQIKENIYYYMLSPKDAFNEVSTNLFVKERLLTSLLT